MAKKNNTYVEEIDLTSYSWVNAGFNKKMGKPGCGGCHPGGGGLEYDRDGNRYDKHLEQHPDLVNRPDGDYYQSKWDKTGVVEADCLLCHQPGYYFKERVKHLARENFRWAVVAGSGFGQVYGSVSAGEVPEVVYNKRFFNDDGKIALQLSPSPKSENCLFCHAKADMIKRGFSWFDDKNHDVHSSENITCASCHPAGIEHQFAKGDENLSTVRDDLDNTMKTCGECHNSGYMGAPKPEHHDIRPNHLEKLSCEACHIPELGRSSALGLDVSTGKVRLFPRTGAAKIGAELKWNPEMHLNEDGKLYPVSAFQPSLYTNRTADGIFVPLFAKEIKSAYGPVKLAFSTEDIHMPLINTRAEITAMLLSLRSTLAESPRFSSIDPCYHSGGILFFLNDEGLLQQQQDTSWAAEPNMFNINHNVAPTQLALGANGCGDCHVDRAAIFSGWLKGKESSRGINDDENMLAVILNHDSRLQYLSHLHKYNHLKTYLIPLLVASVFTLILFREAGGMTGSSRPIQRTVSSGGSPLVIWLIFMGNLSLLFVIFTGLFFFFNNISLLEHFFPTSHSAISLHWKVGVFFVGTIFLFYMLQKGQGRTGSCTLKMYGGKIVIFTMLVSGSLMIYRDSLGPDIIYLASIIHTLTAFFLIAVFGARSYASISNRFSEENRSTS